MMNDLDQAILTAQFAYGHSFKVYVNPKVHIARNYMAGNVSEVTDGSFDSEVLKAQVPVLLDFWAPWCGPCKSIAPVLEEVAKEFSGKIKIAKLNVDDNPKTPSSYDVRGIPNLVFFKGGKVVDRIVGAIPKEQLVAAINKVL